MRSLYTDAARELLPGFAAEAPGFLTVRPDAVTVGPVGSTGVLAPVFVFRVERRAPAWVDSDSKSPSSSV